MTELQSLALVNAFIGSLLVMFGTNLRTLAGIVFMFIAYDFFK